MHVGVDEARDDDPVGGVDHDRVARRDVGPDFADLAVLDQDIGLREIADRPVEREHDAALDQEAARALHARKLGILRLRLGRAAQRSPRRRAKRRL